MSILLSKFVDHKLVQHLLNILKVGDVASGTDDRVIPNRIQTFDILEACQGSIGSWKSRESNLP